MFKKGKLLAFIYLFIIGNFIQCTVQNNDTGSKFLFDLNWRFTTVNNILASEVDFNDQNWRRIDLPHDWSKDPELIKSLNNNSGLKLMEAGWYRKQFGIPEMWLEKSILIEFEGIDNQSEIFVNGKSIADFQKKNDSYQAVLNPYLNLDGENVIAVRIDISKQIDVAFQTELGIYKHAWLVIKENTGFKD